MQLKDKVVFITGGAQGIGRMVAEAVMRKGAKVCFADVKRDQVEATAKELQTSNGADNVFCVKCDVTNVAEFEDAFKAAVAKFGHVDVMCNNAGILDERIWGKQLDINIHNPEMKAAEVRLASICPMGVKTALMDLDDDQIIQAGHFMQVIEDAKYCTVDQVVEAFLLAMEDDTINGIALTIRGKEGVEKMKLSMVPVKL